MDLIPVFVFASLGTAIAIGVIIYQLRSGRQQLSSMASGQTGLQTWFVDGGILSIACWLVAASLAETHGGLLASPPMMTWYIFGTVFMLALAFASYAFSRMIDRKLKARIESGTGGAKPITAESIERDRNGIRRLIWIATQGALASVIMYVGGLVAHIH